MDQSCLISTVQNGGGDVMVWGIFHWHTLGPLVPNECRLNVTVYLSIVADHVYPFMTTVYPSSDGYFQQDNAPCHKISNHLRLVSWTWQWVHFTQMASTVTRSQSNVVEREIRIIDVLLTNLQQLRDATMSIWTKIAEECFQHLVESIPQIIKAVLKAKVGPTRY